MPSIRYFDLDSPDDVRYVTTTTTTSVNAADQADSSQTHEQEGAIHGTSIFDRILRRNFLFTSESIGITSSTDSIGSIEDFLNELSGQPSSKF